MKKNNKKPIDLEREFIDCEVKHRKKLEKKPDLTEKIKKFLEEPKSLESIKTILASIVWCKSSVIIDKLKIYVYSIPCKREYISYNFLIRIFKKDYSSDIYLTSMGCYDLCYFSKKELDSSYLKQTLRHEIYEWLSENIEVTKVIE